MQVFTMLISSFIDLRSLAPRTIMGYSHHPTRAGAGTMILHAKGVSRSKSLDISAITIDATNPEITTTSEHGLSVLDDVFFADTNSTPVIDGMFIVTTVVSATKFEIAFVTTGTGNAGDVWTPKDIEFIGGAALVSSNVFFPIGKSMGPYKFIDIQMDAAAPGETSFFYEELSKSFPTT